MLFAVGVTGSGAGAMIAIGLIAALIYGVIALVIYTGHYLRDLRNVCAGAGTAIWKLIVPFVNVWSLSKIAKKKGMFVLWLFLEIVLLAFFPTFAWGLIEGSFDMFSFFPYAVCAYIQWGVMGRLIWIVLRELSTSQKIVTLCFSVYISFLPALIPAMQISFKVLGV